MIELSSRIHALINRFIWSSDKLAAFQSYQRIGRLHRHHGLSRQDALAEMAVEMARDVLARCRRDRTDDSIVPLAALIENVLEYEEMFSLPAVDWSERRSVAELWSLRDELSRQRAWLEAFPKHRELLTLAFCHLGDAVWQSLPARSSAGEQRDAIVIRTPRVRAMPDIAFAVEQIIRTVFAEDLDRANLFSRHREDLERNLIAASGGNPADPGGFDRAPRMPTKSGIRDPVELVETYLGGSPLIDLFAGDVPVAIPNEARFSHHHIVAGSGHGKTQTLQFLIAEDLKAVAAGERSVIVIDSQGDLIRNIARLRQFAPGQPLHDRLVLIDPTDVEYPVSLNLFDVGQARLADYSQLERERLQNSILELYDFVLGTLLSAEMTQKQSVIFRYVTRLMLHIPDATIHTLRELMDPGSQVKFAEHIERLQGTARHFFETEFPSKEFEATKKQVLRRLWGILENQTFERMFSHPRSKLDLFAEMNAGKVILINTAKDLLKEQGTEIFGRFFIAMIAQAAQERATLSERDRMPTFVYIDEAADYFDRNIGIILSQARKYNVGMVLAHQYLGQLEPKLQDGIAANTAVKFAGGVSNKDARALGPMLGCEPALIEAQPKLSFAASIRGITKGALPLQFPYGHLERLPTIDRDEADALREAMRKRYAVHYQSLSPDPEPETSAENEPAAERPNEQPEADPGPSKPDVTSTDASTSW